MYALVGKTKAHWTALNRKTTIKIFLIRFQSKIDCMSAPFCPSEICWISIDISGWEFSSLFSNNKKSSDCILRILHVIWFVLSQSMTISKGTFYTLGFSHAWKWYTFASLHQIYSSIRVKPQVKRPINCIACCALIDSFLLCVCTLHCKVCHQKWVRWKW